MNACDDRTNELRELEELRRRIEDAAARAAPARRWRLRLPQVLRKLRGLRRSGPAAPGALALLPFWKRRRLVTSHNDESVELRRACKRIDHEHSLEAGSGSFEPWKESR